MRGVRHRLAALAVDVTPLRQSRDFRFLYAGTAISQFGSAFTTVAVPFQLYDLTGSTLAIGLFGARHLVPLLVLNVVGGAIADKVERRRWIVGCQGLGMLTALGLVRQRVALDHPSVVAIFVLGASNVCAFALGAPAERASVIRVVGRDHVASAMALKAMSGSIAHVAGPAVAGVIIAWSADRPGPTSSTPRPSSPPACSSPGSAPCTPRSSAATRRSSSILDGLRHLRRQPVLLGSFASDLNAMVFGAPDGPVPGRRRVALPRPTRGAGPALRRPLRRVAAGQRWPAAGPGRSAGTAWS